MIIDTDKIKDSVKGHIKNSISTGVIDNVKNSIPDYSQAVDWMNKVIEGDAGSYSLFLDWAYNKAVNAEITGVDSASNIALEYRAKNKTIEEAADALINDYWKKTGMVGALTGVGGLGTLPINLVGSTVLQLRMAAAVAILGGWNLEDARVKKALILCALGCKAVNSLSSKVLEMAVRKGAIKFAEKGIAKGIPLVSVLVSGAIDAAATKAIGNVAKKCFITEVPLALTAPAED